MLMLIHGGNVEENTEARVCFYQDIRRRKGVGEVLVGDCIRRRGKV